MLFWMQFYTPLEISNTRSFCLLQVYRVYTIQCWSSFEYEYYDDAVTNSSLLLFSFDRRMVVLIVVKNDRESQEFINCVSFSLNSYAHWIFLRTHSVCFWWTEYIFNEGPSSLLKIISNLNMFDTRVLEFYLFIYGRQSSCHRCRRHSLLRRCLHLSMQEFIFWFWIMQSYIYTTERRRTLPLQIFRFQSL